MSARPRGVCHACYVTWRAAKPRALAVYCWHFGNAARLDPNGWTVLEAVGNVTLARMRRDGEL